jgi:PIN domain nuclease of toxin-antitoxin system
VKILLDTCTFLWIISGDRQLSQTAREQFSDPTNEVYLSSVSVWEIMVKHALGRMPLPDAPERYLPQIRARL